MCPRPPGSPGLPGFIGVFWGLDFRESRTPLWTIGFGVISLCFLAPRALPGPPGLLGVLGPGFPRIPDPSLNHWFWSYSLCFLAPRSLPGPPGLLGCSGVWISKNPGPLSELLFLKQFLCVSLRPGLSRAPRVYCGVLGPYAMFKNRMFYKPYVQKPYVLQNLC